MKLMKRKGASGLVMTVLIWSVASVLGTRLFLSVTGNPTIGGSQWHVAHVLFGGMFMMVAMMLELIFKNKELKRNVAALFGVGWGLFIDEIGKFLTHDNDYWFRPAIMMIYISFVLLFLIYKYLERKVVVKKKANKLTSVLTMTVRKVTSKRIITYGLWIYSIYYSVDKIVDVTRVLTSPQKMIMIKRFYQNYDFFGKSDIYLIVLKMIFDVMAATLFLLGARYFWSKKRVSGIKFFKYGLYINILIGSVFKFYFEQMGAVANVLLGLIMLEVLNEHNRNST